MRIFSLKLLLIFFVAFCAMQTVFAQSNPISDFFPEIKILASNGPAEGYFFMGSKGITAVGASQYISIIDNCGTPVFFRKMNKATSSVRLLEDGRIAYLNGVPRKLYFLNEMLEVTDTLSVEGFKPNGHDWDVSDSGNILLMGQESSVKDMSLIVAGGDTAAEVLDLIVQEFDPEFNLLYTWNSANHFQVTDGNENSSYLDFTEKQIDYVHANGISIDSDTSFLISCRHMDEITKIDRRTGDIIWRLGGKNNQFQFVNDEIGFSHQHGIRSLGNGNILLFDNGNLHFPQLSGAVEYRIDELNKTATLVQRFYHNPVGFSNHAGAVQRVYNNNTIVDWGPYWPSVTEFHSDGTPALEWDFTKHSYCARIEKYKWQTKVFETNLDSVAFGNWESDTLVRSVWLKNNTVNNLEINKIETRTAFFNIKNELPILIFPNDSAELKIWFNPESSETGYYNDVITIASDSETQRIARQVKVTGHKEESIAPFATLFTESSAVSIDSFVKIQFSESVRIETGQELDYNSVDSFVIFKKNNSMGDNVTFNALISSDKKLITIVPQTKLQESSTYYLSLKNGLEDYSGNQLIPFKTVFSTIVTNTSESIKSEHKISIFPNPATSKIIIRNAGINYSLKIYDTTGSLLKQEYFSGGNDNEIDVSKFIDGLYLFVIESVGQKIVKKIIID